MRHPAIQGRTLAPDPILLAGERTIRAPGDDGTPVEMRARATELLAKTAGGWRYLLDHASDAPAAPAK
jgi:ketosteroid isomerase-like protein